ncbi:MAG: DUF6477 family protein [Paracoccus sp. (in: a-proteobacteria)]
MCFISDQNVFDLTHRTCPPHRPASLIRAAQAGQSGWRRARDLPRLLKREAAPATPVALRLLRAAEEAADNARRERRADYDLHRHILLLIALLAEMRAEADPQICAVLPFSVPGTARPARRA